LETDELRKAVALLAGAVSYLCYLEAQELEMELRAGPEARRALAGPLINDVEVMRTYSEQLLQLRDRLSQET